MKILTTDNNCGNFKVESGQCLKDLQHIADCPLDKLTDKENNDVGFSRIKETVMMTK